LWELPFGKGKRVAAHAGSVANAIIGGWQLTGVGRWTSGFPFSVDVGQNWPTDWQYTGLAQLVGSKPKTGVYRQANGSVTIFPDPAAAQAQFIIPYPGSGASRNVLRGQGYAGLDLGLSKRWNFFERQSLQFTWQTFKAKPGSLQRAGSGISSHLNRAVAASVRHLFQSPDPASRHAVRLAVRVLTQNRGNTGMRQNSCLRDAVDRAYPDKYNTRGAIKYARDLGSAKSRATTLELRPLTPTKR
jgi:hypothetical protein